MSALWELKSAMGERNRAAIRAAMEKLGPNASGKAIAAEAGVNYQTAAKHLLAIRGKTRGKRTAEPKPKPVNPATVAGERNRAAVAEAYQRLGPKATIRAISEIVGLSKASVGNHLKAIAGDRQAERRKASEAKRAAVADAIKRLGPKANRHQIAKEAGLSWSTAVHYIRGVIAPEATGGATDKEIAARIVAYRAERPPLIPAPKRKPALTLTEKAVQDYRRARKSLKRGVASYSLLSARPRSA